MDGSQEPKRRNPGSGQAEKARFWCFFFGEEIEKGASPRDRGASLGQGRLG